MNNKMTIEQKVTVTILELTCVNGPFAVRFFIPFIIAHAGFEELIYS